MTNKQKLGLLIIISTLIRVIVGSYIQLGNDEVYYWTYARYPDWSHFDHPPMVGFFEQLFSLNLLFESELALRLGFIISGTLSTILLYFIGKEVKDERTGLLAAILFNTSIYGFIISGLFIMPDGPLVLFWMTSLLFFIKYQKATEKFKINLFLSISMISLSMAVYAKYQAVYLLFGYGLYWILYKRDQLKNPVLYLNISFTALIVFIIVYWNYLNSFSGMSYHSERVTLFSLNFNLDSFLREVVGQIAYNNPYNYIIILIALFSFKNKRFIDLQYFWLFLFISLPLIVTTLFFSLYRDTLPHWSGVSFLCLAVLAAAYLSERPRTPLLYFTLCMVFSLVLIGMGVVNRGWVIDSAFDSKTESTKLGKNDPTLDMFGWDQFRNELEHLETDRSELAGLPLISNKWYPGSHLFYYVARPMEKDLYVLGDMKDMHKYYWINQTRPPLKEGQNGIYITYSRNFKDPRNTMQDYFSEMELLRQFPVLRSGKTVEYGYIYLLRGYKNSNLGGEVKE
ncbi:glycosyltransferase family 39 protein [Lutimonas vermicola]|uniref:Glycosyltransferase family 39 protein n=1 Tax=Lutimonas vermicola TaxID=414288 RepID=A0ABU9L487_9FLAO